MAEAQHEMDGVDFEWLERRGEWGGSWEPRPFGTTTQIDSRRLESRPLPHRAASSSLERDGMTPSRCAAHTPTYLRPRA